MDRGSLWTSLTREPTDLTTRPRSRRWLMALPCLLLVAGIIYAIWFWPAGSGGQTARDRDANQPIPVLVATAAQQDVPIYLDGLGTVQAFNTVTIKPMVDGPLVTVNFAEGQDGAQGRVLAQIDPRTYQAALDQAVGEEGTGRGAARQRAARPRALPKAGGEQLRFRPSRPIRRSAQVAQDEALVQQDQAQIDTARTQLSYTTITSPIDGRTGMRQVDAGNIVHAVGHHRPGGDHPAAADFGAVHPAAAGARAVARAMQPGCRQGAGLRARRRRAARPACWIPARWRCWTTRSIRPPARSS